MPTGEITEPSVAPKTLLSRNQHLSQSAPGVALDQPAPGYTLAGEAFVVSSGVTLLPLSGVTASAPGGCRCVCTLHTAW
jgi:hypothetical protein